jgi:hypothetical protein
VIVGLLYNSLITEAGLWVHLLAVRDSLLFSIFLWFFFKVPSIALRSQQQTGILIP